MGESSASYIHMVQHLIEECIILKMRKDECMEALSRHANILPVITSTGRIFSGTLPPKAVLFNLPHNIYGCAIDLNDNKMWNELEKENKEFFEGYAKDMKNELMECEVETRKRFQNLLSNSTQK